MSHLVWAAADRVAARSAPPTAVARNLIAMSSERWVQRAERRPRLAPLQLGREARTPTGNVKERCGSCQEIVDKLSRCCYAAAPTSTKDCRVTQAARPSKVPAHRSRTAAPAKAAPARSGRAREAAEPIQPVVPRLFVSSAHLVSPRSQ